MKKDEKPDSLSVIDNYNYNFVTDIHTYTQTGGPADPMTDPAQSALLHLLSCR